MLILWILFVVIRNISRATRIKRTGSIVEVIIETIFYIIVFIIFIIVFKVCVYSRAIFRSPLPFSNNTGSRNSKFWT